MSELMIEGGHKLSGEIAVQGAKNSALPILAATLLSSGEHILHNCPKLSDVDAALKILDYLGCKSKREGSALLIDTRNVTRFDIPEHLMREMRSSIVFLGPILSRMGKAFLSMPGGCELGPRPIDMHLEALEKLGATIEEEHGYLRCQLAAPPEGRKIALRFPSVGATENTMLAAVMATGTTMITNAAQEPEIVDLAMFLNRCGAKIKGAGKSIIQIEGVRQLHAAEHRVIPDRIVAATYLCCGLITGGEIELTAVDALTLESILPLLEEMGAIIKTSPDRIVLTAPRQLKNVPQVRTMPYPGFPTDAQAPLMALMTRAKGSSMFVETIFESRYKHVSELCRMGADIQVESRICVVNGVKKLTGATVYADDLRGGAALVVAGLGAEGVTRIRNVHHIDRGYEEIETHITQLNGNIKRIKKVCPTMTRHTGTVVSPAQLFEKV